jgi:hypothetical protein
VRAALRQVGGLLLLVVVAGCGAGGFGSEQPATPDTSIDSYVALGDGFTAAPYVGSTNDAGGCLRSEANYPALVAKDLGIKQVTDVSCTGATTRSVTNSTRTAEDKPKAVPQIDAIAADTGVVTLGFGIEDRGMLQRMFDICAVAFPCGAKVSIQVALADVKAYGTSLTAAVRKIQDKAPTADILLVGYPQFLPTEGNCRELPRLGKLELQLASYLVDQINHEMQSAARQTGSMYVDMTALSVDHAVCSAAPWVSGKDNEPGKSVAFHPLAAEQRAVAEQIELQLKSR